MKSKVHFRIDDRLIHGQVVLGWCKNLGIKKMILCDDEIAQSDFEQDLYACCPDSDQKLEFMSISDCAAFLAEDPRENTIVVMAGPAQALKLQDAGIKMVKLIIGGMHDKSGARRLLDFVYISPQEEEQLESLLASGVDLQCRSLPTTESVPLKGLLK